MKKKTKEKANQKKYRNIINKEKKNKKKQKQKKKKKKKKGKNTIKQNQIKNDKNINKTKLLTFFIQI